MKEGMHFPNRAAEGLRTKTVWKVDFTVIQLFKKQDALCFIALKNTYATKVLLMNIGPINNGVNSYYVFLLFYPVRELYAGGYFKIKMHKHKHILLDINAGES